MWVDAERRPVALTFAGSQDGMVATATPMTTVVEGLSIHFGPGVTLQDYVTLATLD